MFNFWSGSNCLNEELGIHGSKNSDRQHKLCGNECVCGGVMCSGSVLYMIVLEIPSW